MVIIGNLLIKHIDPKKLSERPVRLFSHPGKTTDKIAEAVGSITLATDPSRVIIHTGIRNRASPVDRAGSVSEISPRHSFLYKNFDAFI